MMYALKSRVRILKNFSPSTSMILRWRRILFMLFSLSNSSATPSKLPWLIASLNWNSSTLPATKRLEAVVKADIRAEVCKARRFTLTASYRSRASVSSALCHRDYQTIARIAFLNLAYRHLEARSFSCPFSSLYHLMVHKILIRSRRSHAAVLTLHRYQWSGCRRELQGCHQIPLRCCD
jgi:hypothetical protein